MIVFNRPHRCGNAYCLADYPPKAESMRVGWGSAQSLRCGSGSCNITDMAFPCTGRLAGQSFGRGAARGAALKAVIRFSEKYPYACARTDPVSRKERMKFGGVPGWHYTPLPERRAAVRQRRTPSPLIPLPGGSPPRTQRLNLANPFPAFRSGMASEASTKPRSPRPQ